MLIDTAVAETPVSQCRQGREFREVSAALPDLKLLNFKLMCCFTSPMRLSAAEPEDVPMDNGKDLFSDRSIHSILVRCRYDGNFR